jgi:hypothetical protein
VGYACALIRHEEIKKKGIPAGRLERNIPNRSDGGWNGFIGYMQTVHRVTDKAQGGAPGAYHARKKD